MKLLGSLLLFCTALTLHASPLPDFPFVTVTGESTKKVAPDSATIQLQVLVFEKRANTAQTSLDKTTAKLLQVLQKNDIAPTSISSDEVNKRTKRSRDNRSYEELEILGYELSRHFTIELDDLKKYPTLSTDLLKLDNVVGVSSQFDVTNRQDIEVELIAEAGQKARTKAQLMASGLGVKLGSVFAMNDTGSFQSFFATFGLESQSYSYARGEKLASTRAGNQSSFIPEFIQISKRINVVYKLDN